MVMKGLRALLVLMGWGMAFASNANGPNLQPKDIDFASLQQQHANSGGNLPSLSHQEGAIWITRGGGNLLSFLGKKKQVPAPPTPLLLKPQTFLRFLALSAVSFGIPGYFFPEAIHQILGQGPLTETMQLYQTSWAVRESVMGILCWRTAGSNNHNLLVGGVKAMTVMGLMGFLQDVLGKGWNPKLGLSLAAFHGSAFLWGLILIWNEKKTVAENK